MESAGVWSLTGAKAETKEEPKNQLWKWLKERLDFSKYVPQPRGNTVSQEFEGKKGTYYVLRSPTGQYIKVDPDSYFLWSQMDGTKTVADLAVDYFMKFHAFAFGRLGSLITSLRQKGFLDDSPTYLYGRVSQQLQGSRIATWGNHIVQTFMQRQFSISGLDRILTKLYKGGFRFFFLRPVIWLYWVVVLFGLVIFTPLLIQGGYAFISLDNSIGQEILLVWVGILFTLALHEAAHAFTVKHYGRDVHRGGAMIYLGSLAFFVDTQDIWLADKKARIAVSWAGPFMNLIVGGVLAGVLTFFPNFFLNFLLFKVAVLTYVNAIVNLNPLIELDGYFILMDWLEIPSLRQRSLGFLREKLVKKIKTREAFSSEERIFLVFGLLAGVYTIYVLVVAAIVIPKRSVPVIANICNKPGIWGELVVGIFILVAVLPLSYSLFVRVYLMLKRMIFWLSAQGVFANKRNIALLLLAPAVLFHVVPWIVGQGLWVAEFSRLLFLLLGIGIVFSVLRSYDWSYLQRNILALGVPLLTFLVAECVGLFLWLDVTLLPSGIVTTLRTIGLATFMVAACLSFNADNLKLASCLERALMVGLLFAGVAISALVSVWLLMWAVPLTVSIFTGTVVGIGVLSLALMISLIGSFWHSQLHYAWVYIGLALGILSFIIIMDATPIFQKGVGGAFSLILSLGYSCLSGGIVLYHLTQAQAYAQLRPIELDTGLNANNQLIRAVQHLLESMFLQYQTLFGKRRLQSLQATINSVSVSARWGLVIDRGRLVAPDNLQRVDVPSLALTCRQLLDQAIVLIQQGGGQRFAKQTLRRAYDSLPWESRELTNEYILQSTTWGSWLSRQFKETQQDYTALLSRIPLFFHCTSEELDAICARLEERVYPAGTTIIRQGDMGDAFYIVRSGKVTVWQQDDAGWEQFVNEHSRGGTFGELALLHDAPRNATCIAAIPTTVLTLKREDFQLVRHFFTIQEKVDQSIHYTKILRDIPLFAETSTEQLKQIAARLVPETFEVGQVIMQKGAIGDKFYIVQEGQVEVFVTDDLGQEETIAQRGRGEYVGEVALLLDIPRTASVKAITPAKLLTLTRDEFLELMEHDLEIHSNLSKVSSRRLRFLRQRSLEAEPVVSCA